MQMTFGVLLTVTDDQLADEDWLREKLDDIARTVASLAPATRAPVTGDDGSEIGFWRIVRPVCEYPSCGIDAVRDVDGRKLCPVHASEFREFLISG